MMTHLIAKEKSKEIEKIRDSILNVINLERPSLAELILKENYLVTTIGVSNGQTQELYTLMDFTSKQEDHLHDLENYTIQLYNGFNKPYSVC